MHVINFIKSSLLHIKTLAFITYNYKNHSYVLWHHHDISFTLLLHHYSIIILHLQLLHHYYVHYFTLLIHYYYPLIIGSLLNWLLLLIIIEEKIQYLPAVWWIKVGVNSQESQLSSILAFLNEFKLYRVWWTLFWGFWANKTSTTHWSGSRVQVWVQVWAPARHLAISPKAVPEDNRRLNKILTVKINGQALWAALRHYLRGSERRAQTQGVSESAGVSGTICWPQQARLRNTCYDFCNTHSKGVSSDSHQTAQRLKMAVRIAQKPGNHVWNDSESTATKVCSHIGCKWNVMFDSQQPWQDKLLFSIWRCFVNNHPLCHWPTIDNN